MDKSWKPAWRYQVIDFGEPIGNASGITQKLHIVCPVSGTKLRLFLNNRFNDSELEFQQISVKTQTDRKPVSVNGMQECILQPGQHLWTDPVEIAVCAGETVEVETVFGTASRITGILQTWAARSWYSEFYDTYGLPVDCTVLFPWLGEDVHKPMAAVGVCQVDIFAEESIRTIAMFGDSITHMSYYSDALLERLIREYKGKAVLVNAGIGGNRLCFDASIAPDLGVHSAVFGHAGYKRFEEDVFGTMLPNAVLMLEGINDVTHGFQYGRRDQVPTAEEFCQRYSDVIACAHQHGARIMIGTIMPENVFCGEEWFPLSEKLRQEINDWIRAQKLADGVIDFEKLAADACGKLKNGFHMDDLHPNEAGGKEMAFLVPLEEVLR